MCFSSIQPWSSTTAPCWNSRITTGMRIISAGLCWRFVCIELWTKERRVLQNTAFLCDTAVISIWKQRLDKGKRSAETTERQKRLKRWYIFFENTWRDSNCMVYWICGLQCAAYMTVITKHSPKLSEERNILWKSFQNTFIRSAQRKQSVRRVEADRSAVVTRFALVKVIRPEIRAEKQPGNRRSKL